jgi:selT/selW/selH-like putative selenoprotein
LESAFGNKISIEEIRDPDTTGHFEVVINGELMWSKKHWGLDFPTRAADVKDLCDHINNLLLYGRV